MGWREQVHIGELTCDVLIFSDQTIPGNRTSVIAIEKDAAYGINLTGAYTTNAIKVNQGSLKVHLHDQTAQRYNAEFKSDAQNVTGLDYGITVGTEIEPGGSTAAPRTAGGTRGIASHTRIGSGFTLTGGGDCAIYGQLQNQGTLNGAALYPSVGYLLLGAGGVFTQVAVLSVLHLDSHLASAISAGNSYFLNITNNGSVAQWTAAIKVMASNKITNFLEIETASGMVSANTIGDATFANWKTIKVDLDGTTHYLIAAQAITAA